MSYSKVLSFNEAKETSAPVSYTHLDVYKRQPFSISPNKTAAAVFAPTVRYTLVAPILPLPYWRISIL